MLVLLQAASSLQPGDTKSGVDSQAATAPPSVPAAAGSSFAESRLLALEKASTSTRTYALEKLDDYRIVRTIDKGVGDLRGGGVRTMDVSGIMFGEQIVRDTTAISEVNSSGAQGIFRTLVGCDVRGGAPVLSRECESRSIDAQRLVLPSRVLDVLDGRMWRGTFNHTSE